MRIGDGSANVTLGPHLRLGAESPPAVSRDVGTPGPVGATVAAPSEPSPFARIIRSLGREVDRGEATVKKALSPGGGEMGAGELLALQAGIYRYSEAVDLSAKLVDRATSGLKTVLQGQQ